MNLLMQCLAVGCAGFLGAISRFLVSTVCGRWFGTGFPIGTLVINLSGSLLLGWFITYAAGRLTVSDTMRLAIGVGFVGAYTTFSTYMFESNSLITEGQWIEALVNLFGSLLLGLIAVRAGIWLAAR